MLRPYSIYLHSPLHFITDEHLFYILHEQLGRCYYCHRRIGSASSTIWHCINEHNDKEICILLPRALAFGTKRYRAVHFNVVPATLSCDIENIVCNEVTMTIKVQSTNYTGSLSDSCDKVCLDILDENRVWYLHPKCKHFSTCSGFLALPL